MNQQNYMHTNNIDNKIKKLIYEYPDLWEKNNYKKWKFHLKHRNYPIKIEIPFFIFNFKLFNIKFVKLMKLSFPSKFFHIYLLNIC